MLTQDKAYVKISIMGRENKKSFGIRKPEVTPEFENARQALVDSIGNFMTTAKQCATEGMAVMNGVAILDRDQPLGKFQDGETQKYWDYFKDTSDLNPISFLQGAYYREDGGRSTLEILQPTDDGGVYKLDVRYDQLEVEHGTFDENAQPANVVAYLHETQVDSNGRETIFGYGITRDGTIWSHRNNEQNGRPITRIVYDPQEAQEAAVAIDDIQHHLFPLR